MLVTNYINKDKHNLLLVKTHGEQHNIKSKKCLAEVLNWNQC